MKRQFFTKALTFGLSAAAIILTSCSTTESRISEHPDLFNTLSPSDQQLVQQGQIRYGMTQNAVWLAWGSADQKVMGNMRGTSTETWVYMETTTYGGGYHSPFYGYPYRYGYGSINFGAVGGVYRSHGHHGRFVVFGDPFFDPFYYSYFPPTVSYPYKIVTFAHGRVMSFQYLVSPYR